MEDRNVKLEVEGEKKSRLVDKQEPRNLIKEIPGIRQRGSYYCVGYVGIDWETKTLFFFCVSF